MQIGDGCFNAVSFNADLGGCAHYRMRFPVWAIQTIVRKLKVVETMQLIMDRMFFQSMRCVRLQRQVNDMQCKYFLEILKPLSEVIGFWLIYEVDDVISYEDIPPYNVGRDAYDNKIFFSNVKRMLEASDFFTVTTDILKQYYIDKFELNPDKILVIPNYLPMWWIGESYQLERIKRNYDANKKKPRIVFPMSSSHFDIQNKNGGIDDFSTVADFVRSTVDKYHWIIIGHCPHQVQDLIQGGKIEMAGGSDILNYPRHLANLNAQAIVAPLLDNTFNRAKSSIKLQEGWAMGIPVIAQDLPCYNKYTEYTFKDGNDLQNQLDSLLRDRNKFLKIVKGNYNTICHGDKNAPNGWWLENNLDKWIKIYTLPQKTLKLDLTSKIQQLMNRTDPELFIDLEN